jgi:hypothetical protein
LNSNQSLGGVRVVVENFVDMELIDDAIKGARVNMDFSPVLVEVPSVPVVKEVELGCLLDSRVLMKDPCSDDFVAKSVDFGLHCHKMPLFDV